MASPIPSGLSQAIRTSVKRATGMILLIERWSSVSVRFGYEEHFINETCQTELVMSDVVQHLFG